MEPPRGTAAGHWLPLMLSPALRCWRQTQHLSLEQSGERIGWTPGGWGFVGGVWGPQYSGTVQDRLVRLRNSLPRSPLSVWEEGTTSLLRLDSRCEEHMLFHTSWHFQGWSVSNCFSERKSTQGLKDLKPAGWIHILSVVEDKAPCLISNLPPPQPGNKHFCRSPDDLCCEPASHTLKSALDCFSEGWPRFHCWVCREALFFLLLLLNASTWQNKTQANIITKCSAILMKRGGGKGTPLVRLREREKEKDLLWL